MRELRVQLSPLGAQIYNTIRRISADAELLFSSVEGNPEWDAYQRRVDEGETELDALAKGLPARSRTLGDVMAIALIAHYWADKQADGTLGFLDPENSCPPDYWTARLIKAVIEMGGRSLV